MTSTSHSGGGTGEGAEKKRTNSTSSMPSSGAEKTKAMAAAALGERRKSRVPAKVPLTDINEFLMCQLCIGYLIDATAIVECQHAFCKSCILKYLETNSYCPICEVQLNEAKPHSSLRSDEILQKLVYKLVPGLFVTEVRKRKEFLSKFSGDSDNTTLSGESCASSSGSSTTIVSSNGVVSDILSSMELKEGEEELVFLSPDDCVSLSLEYFKSTPTLPPEEEKQKPKSQTSEKSTTATGKQKLQQQSSQQQEKESSMTVSSSSTTAAAAAASSSSEEGQSKKLLKSEPNNENNNESSPNANTCSDKKANDRRYLQCQAAVSVGSLKKFIRMKYGLSDDYRVDLLYNGNRDNNLENDLTLLDLAFIYKWKKAEPMCFHYRIFDRPFKSTNARPGSKRAASSLMDEEPPNDDDATSGPSRSSSRASPAPSKLTRFSSSSTSTDTKTSAPGKCQPKNKSMSTENEKVESKEVKPLGNPKVEDVTPGKIGGSEETKPKLVAEVKSLPMAKPAVVDQKQQPLATKTEQPVSQKLTINTPKVPPLIVTSPPRDPTSPLKISLGLLSAKSGTTSCSSASGSPEGKTHHHHHHHHHKHRRHHKESKHHHKHSKSKSKDRDKEKGCSGSHKKKSSSKDKESKKNKEKAKSGQFQQPVQNINSTNPMLETKDKETRYKYNAHPNPNQSQTISIKAGKFPNTNNVASSLLLASQGSNNNLSNNANANANAGNANNNKKVKNMATVSTGTSTIPSASGMQSNKSTLMAPLKKIPQQQQQQMSSKQQPEGILERRVSSSSTASSSSQASMTVSLKTSKLIQGSTGQQQQQQQRSTVVLPDSVHLQVPKSVTLIPVNPNSGQLLGKSNQRNSGQGGTGIAGLGGGRMTNATTFTHPITNKSLNQITVTEVPPPTSKSSSSSSSSNIGNNSNNSLTIERSTGTSTSSLTMNNSLQLHKQFNGPGSMEITKIYCDKSGSTTSTTSSSGGTKVFDAQGKKLKGLDISITSSRKSSLGGSFENISETHSKGNLSINKNTGLPKIPGVSILPQALCGNANKQKLNNTSSNSMTIHSISASGAGTATNLGRIGKEKGQGSGNSNNRLSITTIQQQQQQQQQQHHQLKIPMSGENRAKNQSMAAPLQSSSIRRSSSPNRIHANTPPKRLQQSIGNSMRISPSPPTSLKINRRSSIEITPVGAATGGSNSKNKIKRPFESTLSRQQQQNQSSASNKSISPSLASPPGKREKLGRNTGKPGECPLDLSGKSSRSTPPSSNSDYDSSNSSFTIDRPPTPNISITSAASSSSQSHGQQQQHVKSGKSGSHKSHSSNVSHGGTQTIPHTFNQKHTFSQNKEQKSSTNRMQQQQQQQPNNSSNNGNIGHHVGNLNLSPPIMPPHSPPTASGFHPLGNLLTLSNAAAHVRKMNHHNHPLNNLALVAAASAGGFCQNLLRPPQQQHSPSAPSSSSSISSCLNPSSPPISPNQHLLNSNAGLLSHFSHHHQMSMSNLMNSPLMQMNAASLLDPTSPASLFCARMGFPQPNPSSPLGNNSSNAVPSNNPYFSTNSPLTRPQHSSPSTPLRIPHVSPSKQQQHQQQHVNMPHAKSPTTSHHNNPLLSFPSPGKGSSHSPKFSNSSSSPSAKEQKESSINKTLKLNGIANTNNSGSNTFVAPSSIITPQTKAQAESVKNAIPNVMKISNFLPTTKSLSANTNATITSSCGDLDKLLNELPTSINKTNLACTSMSSSSSKSAVKDEDEKHSHHHHHHHHHKSRNHSHSSVPSVETTTAAVGEINSCPTSSKSNSTTTGSTTSSSSLLNPKTIASGQQPPPQQHQQQQQSSSSKKSHKTSTKYLCSPGGIKLLAPSTTPSSLLTPSPLAVSSLLAENQSESSDSADSETKPHHLADAKNEEKNVGLGALGIALGLIPREREQQQQQQQREEVPLLSLSCSSSATTMGRTTQQQNLAVRHIPNPSLIFSRQNSQNNSNNNSNNNGTSNNQILSTNTENMKVKEIMENPAVSPTRTTAAATITSNINIENNDKNKREGTVPIPQAPNMEKDVKEQVVVVVQERPTETNEGPLLLQKETKLQQDVVIRIPKVEVQSPTSSLSPSSTAAETKHQQQLPSPTTTSTSEQLADSLGVKELQIRLPKISRSDLYSFVGKSEPVAVVTTTIKTESHLDQVEEDQQQEQKIEKGEPSENNKIVEEQHLRNEITEAENAPKENESAILIKIEPATSGNNMEINEELEPLSTTTTSAIANDEEITNNELTDATKNETDETSIFKTTQNAADDADGSIINNRNSEQGDEIAENPTGVVEDLEEKEGLTLNDERNQNHEDVGEEPGSGEEVEHHHEDIIGIEEDDLKVSGEEDVEEEAEEVEVDDDAMEIVEDDGEGEASEPNEFDQEDQEVEVEAEFQLLQKNDDTTADHLITMENDQIDEDDDMNGEVEDESQEEEQILDEVDDTTGETSSLNGTTEESSSDVPDDNEGEYMEIDEQNLNILVPNSNVELLTDKETTNDIISSVEDMVNRVEEEGQELQEEAKIVSEEVEAMETEELVEDEDAKQQESLIDSNLCVSIPDTTTPIPIIDSSSSSHQSLVVPCSTIENGLKSLDEVENDHDKNPNTNPIITISPPETVGTVQVEPNVLVGNTLPLLSIITSSNMINNNCSSSVSSTSPHSTTSTGRPSSLAILNNSPVSKLFSRSGSNSPCSPSDRKPGDNIRKMENLEKVAAGLLATATNINNNNISTSGAGAAGTGGALTATSTSCDLTISSSTTGIITSSLGGNGPANQQTLPPVSNV